MKKLILAALFFSGWTSGASAQVAVIAHKSVPVDTITSSELLDCYSGEVRLWRNGQPIIIFDLKPKGNVKEKFYEYIGKTSSRMKSIWMVNMLSGEGDPPQSLESEDEMLKKVAATKGSIGFISKTKISHDVKVLAILEQKNK